MKHSLRRLQYAVKTSHTPVFLTKRRRPFTKDFKRLSDHGCSVTLLLDAKEDKKQAPNRGKPSATSNRGWNEVSSSSAAPPTSRPPCSCLEQHPCAQKPEKNSMSNVF